MALSSGEEFDLKRIYKLIKDKRYIKNCKVEESELKKIYKDYMSFYKGGQLEKIKNEILNILNENIPKEVHSIRARVKDPDHLIEKIIRNSSDNEKKYDIINEDNYNKIITDLIGVRIIILDKRDWRNVHECIIKLFNNDSEKYVTDSNGLIQGYDTLSKSATEKGKELKNSYHVEMPQVYITAEDDMELYKSDDLKINRSRTNYRSIHYIIRYKNVYFEIQVRTLFEEGWLEFDHRIKYPYDQKNRKKNNYIEIFNSLAQAADKLISFYDEKDFDNSNEPPEEIDNIIKVESNNTNSDGSIDSQLKRLF